MSDARLLLPGVCSRCGVGAVRGAVACAGARLAAVLALLFVFAPAFAQPGGGGGGDDERRVVFNPHSMMVKVAPQFEADDPIVALSIEVVGGWVDWRSELVPGLMSVRFPNRNAVEAAETLSQLAWFDAVQLARRGSFAHGSMYDPTPPNCLPNDPLFGQQANLFNTGQVLQTQCAFPPVAGLDSRATNAWCRATDCSNKIIAIVDTGVSYSHPDLKSNMWKNSAEYNGVSGIDDDVNGIVDDIHGAMFQAFGCALVFCPPTICPWIDWPMGDPRGADGHLNHGTHCASIVGAVANNEIDVAGVCWTARIMSVAVAPPELGAYYDCANHWCNFANEFIGYVQAMEYAVKNNANIINVSWGFNTEPLGLREIFFTAQERGIIVVVIAHNNGINLDAVQLQPINTAYPNGIKAVPAIFKREFGLDNVIVSTAIGMNGVFPGTNYGPNTVDLAAFSPCVRTIGVSALAPDYCGDGWFGASSASAPQVAGAVGLVWSANPTWTHVQVVDRILSTTRFMPTLIGRVGTRGVLDINAAVP